MLTPELYAAIFADEEDGEVVRPNLKLPAHHLGFTGDEGDEQEIPRAKAFPGEVIVSPLPQIRSAVCAGGEN